MGARLGPAGGVRDARIWEKNQLLGMPSSDERVAGPPNGSQLPEPGSPPPHTHTHTHTLSLLCK